jgi:hypothetical protein
MLRKASASATRTYKAVLLVDCGIVRLLKLSVAVAAVTRGSRAQELSHVSVHGPHHHFPITYSMQTPLVPLDF